MIRPVSVLMIVVFVVGALGSQPCCAGERAGGEGSSLWAQVGPLLAMADEQAAPEPVPWPQRRGPAFADDYRSSIKRDLRELPSTLWADTKSAFTNPVVWAGLIAAGAAGATLDASGADDTVEDRVRDHRQLCGPLDSLGDCAGDVPVQLPVAAAMYAVGLWRDDTKLYETSKTVINALIITGATNLVLKGVVDRERPDTGDYGWPSGHASSSFAFATVLNEAYGLRVGIPLYAFATFVGYQRVDSRRHYLGDVVSGAIIGAAIGYAVATDHEPKILGMDVLPLAGSDGTVGFTLIARW